MQAAGRMRQLERGQSLFFAGTEDISAQIREAWMASCSGVDRAGAPPPPPLELTSLHMLSWVGTSQYCHSPYPSHFQLSFLELNDIVHLLLFLFILLLLLLLLLLVLLLLYDMASNICQALALGDVQHRSRHRQRAAGVGGTGRALRRHRRAGAGPSAAGGARARGAIR